MAVMKQGILGGLQNKIGSVVGSSWKGIAVLKSMPVSVANPKTALQLAQRAKMTNVVNFSQLILANLIKPLWDRFASKMSGYNDFVSTNIALFANPMPNPLASLIISQGKMASTTIATSITDVSDGITTITWANDAGVGLKLATDETYVLVVNSTKGTVFSVAALSERSDLSTTCANPTGTVLGDTVQSYLAFRRTDGTVVSNTGTLVSTVQA